MPPEHKLELLQRFNQAFAEAVPFNRALGLRFEDYEPNVAVLRLPYSPKLVGNPESGVLHGGTITSLMDAACGAAVFLALGSPTPIATLDLRIDYLKPAVAQLDVLCHATCTKVTGNVAFVTARAHHPDEEADPIAQGAGTFIIFREGGKTSFMERQR